MYGCDGGPVFIVQDKTTHLWRRLYLQNFRSHGNGVWHPE